MKSYQLNFQVSFFRVFIWSLFVATAAFLAWGCEKDNTKTDPITDEPTREYPSEQVDPFDVITFVNPLEHVMYVDPEFFQVALEELNAQPLGPEKYLLSSPSFAGDIVEFPVRVEFVPAPIIADIADIQIAAISDVVLEGKDDQGTPIRVRRNMKCGAVLKALTTDCAATADGKSSYTVFPKVSICAKGEAYCPEVFSIWRITYVYKTKGCSGDLDEVQTQRHWVCKG